MKKAACIAYRVLIKSVDNMEGKVVTYGWRPEDSNTYMVDSEDGDYAILKHPLSEVFLMRVPKTSLNKYQANLKGSNERGLDYIKNNLSYLSVESLRDFEALCFFYIYIRELTPIQKKTLSDILGVVAALKLNYDHQKAIRLIQDNEGILDDFNTMWYHNFQDMFEGRAPVSSEKQKKSIFNMAGFVLAEQRNPTATIGAFN